MANFLHRWLNPHCVHCIEDKALEKTCFSCDTLRLEVTRLQRDNERLLSRLLEKPEVENRTVAPEATAPLPLRIPWRVRQQQLEMKDREEAVARKLANAAPKMDVADLEKEMEVVEEERKNAT